jgi:mevalonate pyrophosphate decarboxylase
MKRSRHWLLFAALVAATLGFHAPAQDAASRLARSASDSTAALVASTAGEVATIAMKPNGHRDDGHRTSFPLALLPTVVAAVLAAMSLAVAVRTDTRLAVVRASGAGSRGPPAL